MAKLHFDSRLLRILTSEMQNPRRNVLSLAVTMKMKKRLRAEQGQMVKTLQMRPRAGMGQMVVKVILLRRNLAKERPRHLPQYGMIVSVLDHPNTPLTLTPSPSDVAKQVEDQVDFLLSLSQEPEYVKLVKQVADIPVGPTSHVYYHLI